MESAQTFIESSANLIKLDPSRVLGAVDDKVYSGFLEHMGRCIYGGIVDFDSTVPGLTNEKGYRLDVADALKELNMPVVRYPGGNFVSSYHWLDGVGPKDQRPRRPELAWLGEEPNHFGTDEFMEWCEYMNTEPYLCLNMGTGTLDEALAWVEYCNSDKNTYYANLRRKNGHEKPYNVKYWSLGNEVWGPWQVGQMPAADYGKKAFQWAKALKLLDPNIKLVACGCTGFEEWDYIVTQALISQVDLYSIHLYTSSDDHYKNVTGTAGAERGIQICSKLLDLAKIQQKAYNADVKICFDEWNVWDGERAPGYLGAEEQYTLSDALAVASWCNVFIRQASLIGMANIAQLVNVIAPIMTSKTDLFLQTIYHPFLLFCKYMRGESLNLHVESPTYKGDTGCSFTESSVGGELLWVKGVEPAIPMLDVSATKKDGIITIAVVNRSLEDDLTTKIVLEGDYKETVTVYTVHHDDIAATNTFENKEVVKVEESTCKLGDLESYTFRKHSFVMLRISS
ncbi:glycoside hydrolase superfamily [Myxozyma melibiosi]|uniref:non-reducing end alpha-L-arabinofuranosidase n=1 Tax=Myxozyma melibiosi TaxID=54550 RepID=A0ABR1EZ64_9ASCO